MAVNTDQKDMALAVVPAACQWTLETNLPTSEYLQLLSISLLSNKKNSGTHTRFDWFFPKKNSYNLTSLFAHTENIFTKTKRHRV